MLNKTTLKKLLRDQGMHLVIKRLISNEKFEIRNLYYPNDSTCYYNLVIKNNDLSLFEDYIIKPKVCRWTPTIILFPKLLLKGNSHLADIINDPLFVQSISSINYNQYYQYGQGLVANCKIKFECINQELGLNQFSKLLHHDLTKKIFRLAIVEGGLSKNRAELMNIIKDCFKSNDNQLIHDMILLMNLLVTDTIEPHQYSKYLNINSLIKINVFNYKKSNDSTIISRCRTIIGIIYNVDESDLVIEVLVDDEGQIFSKPNLYTLRPGDLVKYKIGIVN